MKYAVARVVSRDGKFNLVYRAKSGHEFFWVEHITDKDVLWTDKEDAERLARLDYCTAIIPRNVMEVM